LKVWGREKVGVTDGERKVKKGGAKEGNLAETN
jgi:hypothetical protein